MKIAEDQLHRRPRTVSALLRPVAATTSGPATAVVRVSGLTIIGTFDEARPTTNYRDWRFATTAHRHHAMYFEVWRRTARAQFEWISAYLNIYRRQNVDEAEVVCLHCDPGVAPTAPHAKYKRGPHIHFSTAGIPLKDAHVALGLDESEALLSSWKLTHRALEHAIQMIRDEVLDRLAATTES